MLHSIVSRITKWFHRKESSLTKPVGIKEDYIQPVDQSAAIEIKVVPRTPPNRPNKRKAEIHSVRVERETKRLFGRQGNVMFEDEWVVGDKNLKQLMEIIQTTEKVEIGRGDFGVVYKIELNVNHLFHLHHH